MDPPIPRIHGPIKHLGPVFARMVLLLSQMGFSLIRATHGALPLMRVAARTGAPVRVWTVPFDADARPSARAWWGRRVPELPDGSGELTTEQ